LPIGPSSTPRFASLLDLATKVRLQEHYAPEVECIGKGKARAPYEFGCKVSMTSSKGGQFVLHATALHGNPYDGDTLRPMIQDLESLTGIATRRIHIDKGYRGHKHPNKFRVWISGHCPRTRAVHRRPHFGAYSSSLLYSGTVIREHTRRWWTNRGQTGHWEIAVPAPSKQQK
jgi:transposase, IS5 family